MSKSNIRPLKKLETPAAWTRAARKRVSPKLPTTDSLYPSAKQVAIARAVEGSGAPDRDPNEPAQHSVYTVEDFRSEFLDNQLLELPQVDAWASETSPEALRRMESLKKSIHETFGWPHFAIEVYILTGQLPAPVNPIEVDHEAERDPSARRIVLKVDPNSSKEEVAEAYVRYRDSVVERRVRRPDERNLALSLQEYDLRGEELGTWKDRMDHWNRHATENGRPDWTFTAYTSFYAEVRKMAERPLNASWRENLSIFGD